MFRKGNMWRSRHARRPFLNAIARARELPLSGRIAVKRPFFSVNGQTLAPLATPQRGVARPLRLQIHRQNDGAGSRHLRTASQPILSRPPDPDCIMHARLQAEFAAWIAAHSADVAPHFKQLDGLEIEAYWVHSKSRLQRWQAALKLFESDLIAQPVRHNPWPALETVVEEIILSEVLTRVWSALLLVIDRHRGRDDFSGLVYSVFLRHLEAKNRALRMMLSARELNPQAFERLNRLRRSVERWTDLLLASLAPTEVAAKFACDRQRHADFARERSAERPHDQRRRAAVLQPSFQAALQAQSRRWGANPQLNRQIVESVLMAFDRNLVECVALPSAVVQLWLEKSTHDTAALVAALDRIDRTATPLGA